MQDASPALPHWAFQILYLIASCGAGGVIVKLITVYQNRKLPSAKVHESEARTTQITVKTNTIAGDAVIKMMDRLDEALDSIDRLRSERDKATETVETQKIELASYDQQLKKMKAIIDISGVKLSDFDIPREKKH